MAQPAGDTMALQHIPPIQCLLTYLRTGTAIPLRHWIELLDDARPA